MDIKKLLEMTSTSGCIKPTRPWMVGWENENEIGYIFRPDCKCWNCEACSAHLRTRWSVRVFLATQKYIADGEGFRFLTLTSHEYLKTLSSTLYVWPKAWKKLLARANYAVDGTWHWALIPEMHKDGRLHVHLIESANLGTKWWKDNARASGLGWRAEEEEFKAGGAEPGRAAAYASKYLGKQLGVKNWPRYFHHIRTSQHYPELPPMGENPYLDVVWHTLKTRDMLHWVTMQEKHGVKLYYTGTGEGIN